jgi:hypothetical protein
MVALETKWHGPTNTRGSRISCARMDANPKMASKESPDRISVSADDRHSGERQHFEAVTAFCARYDWHGKVVCGGTSAGYVWVFVPKDTPTTDASAYPRVWEV